MTLGGAPSPRARATTKTTKATKTTRRPSREPVRSRQDDLNNRIFFRLFQVMNQYERQAQRLLGYSGVQGAVLGALSVAPVDGLPLAELVEHLAVSRQNLDGVLKRLETLGYVQRVADPSNRRKKLVRLTASGAKAWARLIEQSLVFYRHAMSEIAGSEKAPFFDVLVRLGRGLRAIDTL